ncbi:fungal-specific transcription factor domain-containing protein [Xylogone sp. PMI_703]|nr:fungal-specific transcription factor domain-containing protein [Xylogone sp. PMI_703]
MSYAEASGAKARRRRAPRACASCNARKVRCDIPDVGCPCTGCRVEGYECHVPERKKRRKAAGVDPRNRPPVAKPEDVQSSQPLQAGGTQLLPRITAIETRSPSGHADSPLQTSGSPQPSLSQHTILHQVPHYPFIVNFARISTAGEVGLRSPGPSTSYDTNASDLTCPDIRKLPEHFGFLKHQATLDLPDKSVTDEFISYYFRLVHPFFPVIDKPSFLASYRQMWPKEQQSHSGPSLLLLQAVLFAASSVTPLELLKKAGYSSRKTARESLYTKAKLLYNFDYEPDNIISVQALLLISHYYSSMIEQKHTWHWVHQAISLAQASGLHRNPGDIPQRRIWARIWWACLVRDRMVSLGTGRPMHVNSLDCDVPMLSLEDLREDEDTPEEIAVKEMFVEFVKLCQYIEGVLSLRYSPAAAARATQDQVKVCDDALKSWLSNLPASARRQEEPLNMTGHVNIATLYRSVLRQLYNVTIIALHQPHHIHGTHEVEYHEQAQQEVKLAALDTTNLVTQLVNSDLVKYCPTYCVTSVLPPLIIHLLEIRSSRNPTVTTLFTNQYNLCMIFLRELGDVYWHASFYYDFFELAASIDNEFLEPRQSRTHDPLIAFLKQQMAIRTNHSRLSGDSLLNRSKKQSSRLSTSSLPSSSHGTAGPSEQTVDSITVMPSRTPYSEEPGGEGSRQSNKASSNGEDNLQYEMAMSSEALSATPDEEFQFEELLKGYETFQNIFPSA